MYFLYLKNMKLNYCCDRWTKVTELTFSRSRTTQETMLFLNKIVIYISLVSPSVF